MGKKHHKHHRCDMPEACGYHVHCYCEYNSVEDCHRHIIRGVTAPAPNKPCHRHEYKGKSSCNDGHEHPYCGTTGDAERICNGHVHNFSGKVSKICDHKHVYCGTTDREKAKSVCYERPFCRC